MEVLLAEVEEIIKLESDQLAFEIEVDIWKR